MLIRKCTKEDLNSIREIYNEAIANTTAVYEYDPFTEEYIFNWFEEKQSKGFPILIMEINNEVAGFSTYGTFRTRTAYKTTMEHSVYVHPKYRMQGLGRALLRAIIQEAEKNQIHVLVGGIDGENELSIKLHLKEGFQIAGTIHQSAWKFGRWLDLVFMEKRLNS